MVLDDYLLAADAFRAGADFHREQNAPVVVQAWDAALPVLARRAHRDGVGLDYFNQMIGDLREMLGEFYAATTAPFASSDRRSLWAHQQIGLFDNLDPRKDIDAKRVKQIAERYRASPFIENEYLSWCLLDSLIGAEIKNFSRIMATTQFGSAPANPAYFMSKGDPARYRILKPLFFVLGLIANYVTPALVGYYAVESGHEIIGGLLYAIAAIGVFSFVATYSKRQAVKKRNEALLEKVLEIYAALDGGAFPDARLSALLDEANALGVRFDKIIPAIVDMRRMQRDGIGENA